MISVLQHLENWNILSISLMGPIAALGMNTLSQINYTFNMLLVFPKLTDLPSWTVPLYNSTEREYWLNQFPLLRKPNNRGSVWPGFLCTEYFIKLTIHNQITSCKTKYNTSGFKQRSSLYFCVFALFI